MKDLGAKTDRWSSQSTLFYVTVWWILLVSLAVFGLLRTLEAIERRGRGLFKKFDIYQTDVTSSLNRTNEIYVLMGRSIWRPHIS